MRAAAPRSESERCIVPAMRTLRQMVCLIGLASCGTEPLRPDAGPGPVVDGADPGAEAGAGAGGGAGVELTPPEGECQVQAATPPDEGAQHTAACAAITYRTRPPASGTHYPSWPVFRIYDRPVPWGFLVHGLEHGAVVIAYNCPGGCPAEIEAARAMIAALPAKPGCPRPSVILTPDPTLDTRFAASAWRRILRATCFDRARFAQFVQENVDRQGPEANLPGDCGALDLEARGWCGAQAP